MLLYQILALLFYNDDVYKKENNNKYIQQCPDNNILSEENQSLT